MGYSAKGREDLDTTDYTQTTANVTANVTTNVTASDEDWKVFLWD